MIGIFACPECGAEVELEGLTPGRTIRCTACSTLVEVPFLPRAAPSRRYRGSKRTPWTWIRAGGGLGILGVLALSMWIWHHGRTRSYWQEVVQQSIAESEAAAEAEQFGPAFHAAETALRLAQEHDAVSQDTIEVLQARRDVLARLDVEARLKQLETLEPTQSFGEILTLRDRVEADPALDGFLGTVEAHLKPAHERWLLDRVAEVRRGLQAGRHAEVLMILKEVHQRALTLPSSLRQRTIEQVWPLARTLVDRAGVRVNPVQVDSTIACTHDHDADLRPLLGEALGRRGFLLRPSGPPFRELWDRAPYTLTIHLKERPDKLYGSSPHQTTYLEALLTLEGNDIAPWRQHVLARTRIPLQGLATHEMTHISVGRQANPAIERLFHDDAWNTLVSKLQQKLEQLPEATRLEPSA